MGKMKLVAYSPFLATSPQSVIHCLQGQLQWTIVFTLVVVVQVNTPQSVEDNTAISKQQPQDRFMLSALLNLRCILSSSPKKL